MSESSFLGPFGETDLSDQVGRNPMNPIPGEVGLVHLVEGRGLSARSPQARESRRSPFCQDIGRLCQVGS